MRECLRGEGRVALVETCGAAVTAGEQRREPAWQEEREGANGERPARHTHPPESGGLRIPRGGAVAAGLRHGQSAQGGGEGDAADNCAAHRAAEPAYEARTNPLVGLGSKACRVKRDWHREGLW